MEIKKIEDKIADPTNYLDGVFYFSNPSDEDFKALWNNVEYIFAANTCSPILIQDCTPLEIQEIRKRFAYRWAEEQWYAGKDYKKMVKQGGSTPPLRDDKVLEALIQKCLTPLPVKEATTHKVSVKTKQSGKSKPIQDGFDTKEVFKEATPEEIG